MIGCEGVRRACLLAICLCQIHTSHITCITVHTFSVAAGVHTAVSHANRFSRPSCLLQQGVQNRRPTRHLSLLLLVMLLLARRSRRRLVLQLLEHRLLVTACGHARKAAKPFACSACSCPSSPRCCSSCCWHAREAAERRLLGSTSCCCSVAGCCSAMCLCTCAF